MHAVDSVDSVDFGYQPGDKEEVAEEEEEQYSSAPSASQQFCGSFASFAPVSRQFRASFAPVSRQFRTVSHGSRGFVRFHVLLHCVISPISHRFRTVSHMFRPLSTSFTYVKL